MRLLRMTSLVLFLTLCVIGNGMSEEEKTKPRQQENCPVLGGKVDKKLYAEHKGKRVYFCCSMCVDKFKKDPEKYIKKLEDQGIMLEKAQTHCPVLGGEVDKEVYVDYKGKRVYFCCPMCKKKFNKDPEKYIKKLEDQGITLEETPELEKTPEEEHEGKMKHRHMKKEMHHEMGEHHHDMKKGHHKDHEECKGDECG